jgi:alkylated DNA repair dioxygenase AlkB
MMMELFLREIDVEKNLLPIDGLVNYYGQIINTAEAKKYTQILYDEIEWRNDETTIFGKKIITKRKVAWYGDKPFAYTYSKSTKLALPWTPTLQSLKTLIEETSGESYNSCLLNLYHTGEEGMGWHSDDEKELKKDGAIASLSFGAERKFVLKHKKNNQKIELSLEDGSLLVMKGITQKHWLHRLPPSKKISELRINLTFRTII